jgi:hypothetical protein
VQGLTNINLIERSPMADDILSPVPSAKSGTKEYHQRKSREWYQRTKTSAPEKLDERHRYVAERRRAAKAEWVKRLGGACVHCGGTFPDCVFEFHHINSEEKEYSPSHIFARTPSIIEAELKKCVMLCANCHRVEHDKLKYADHAKRTLGNEAKAAKAARVAASGRGPGGRFRSQYRIGGQIFKTQAEAARALGISASLVSIRCGEKQEGWVREMIYEV